MRFFKATVFVALATFLLPGATCPLIGQATSDEIRKRELFLRSREQIRTEPAPASSPIPRAVPVTKPRASATPTTGEETVPKAQPVKTPAESPDQNPAPTPAQAGEQTKPDPTPEATPGPSATPSATPPTKRAIVIQQPTPRPKKVSKTKGADVVIEKSGRSEERGFEPAPKGMFGGRFRYLTPAIRKAIDQAPVKKNRWKYIIVHNSATRQGSARIFDNYHRNVRKMQNGLAYHFVIGNGTTTGDGQIEIGNRWTRQINGGHVASDYLNNIALGICFVGDFDRDLPNKKQLAALDELIRYLRRRVGRVDGKQSIVKGHREINPRPTSCPGKRFPLDWLRKSFN